MAAPTKTARIGLLFDQTNLQNSWFLVDFSKHSNINDVASEIRECYFKNVPSTTSTIVLGINNFLLPSNGSSELFRENDVVSVRLEEHVSQESGSGDACGHRGKWMYCSSDYSSKQNSPSSLAIEETCVRKKKKRRRSDTDINHESSAEKKSKKTKRKLKESESSAEYPKSDGLENIHTSGQDIPQDDDKLERKKDKAKKKKHKRKSKVQSPSNISNSDDIKQGEDVVPDSSFTEVLTGTQMVESHESQNSAVQNDTVSNDAAVKKKRKRVRKRNKKSSKSVSLDKTVDSTASSSSASINDGQQRYVGKEVDTNVSSHYGALPDKLEPPKYYRHGYRNLNKYEIEPNKHQRFGENLDSEVEKSTQQYNFLCRLRKLAETDINEDAEFSEQVKGDDHDDKKVKHESLGSNNGQTGGTELASKTTDELMHTQAISYNSENGLTDHYERFGEAVLDESKQCSENLSQNQSFTAVPLSYAEPSFEKEAIQDLTESTFSMRASPVSLEKKTLKNGVSVFVRQRASPGARFKELSKQEQLETVATNVSTVFTNPPEFKIPVSPAPSPRSLPEKINGISEDSTLPNVTDKDMSTCTFDGTDLANLKPLVGAPKAGDTIAYKVLEISADCTPEVSEYKVARVLSVDDQQMLQLKHLNKHYKEKNKFHVEIEDEEEILTNTESEADVVWLHQSSLLQPGIVASSGS